MKTRRRTFEIIKGDQSMQKCFALCVYLKKKLPFSRIEHYSTNKLSQISGISFQFAKKMELLLIKQNFAHFEGNTNNKVMVINTLSSHTANRNISIDKFKYSSYKTVLRSVQSFIILRLQSKKDYMKQLLQTRHAARNSKEFKKAIREVKQYVSDGKLKNVDTHYNESGLSLERIAKEIGCCVRTAQRVVDYAIKRRWMKKHNHSEQVFVPGVNYRPVEGFTFSTKNNLYTVYANTYTLYPSIVKALSC